MPEEEKYINVSTRQIDFVQISEDSFFQPAESASDIYEEAENIASHPLSNIYTSNLKWALTSFDLWEFHTNFSITSQTLATIEDVPGVESISQHTRYRGIISIGRLFDTKLVKKQIIEKITEKFQEQNKKMEDFNKSPSSEVD